MAKKVKFRREKFGFGTIDIPVPTKIERFRTIKGALRNMALKKRLRKEGKIF